MSKQVLGQRHAPQGYVAVNRPLAEQAYERDVEVTLVGSNVNSFHVFGGWHLGCTVQKSKVDEQTNFGSFDSLVNNFLFYLDSELGKYARFYVKRSDLSKVRNGGNDK